MFKHIFILLIATISLSSLAFAEGTGTDQIKVPPPPASSHHMSLTDWMNSPEGIEQERRHEHSLDEDFHHLLDKHCWVSFTKSTYDFKNAQIGETHYLSIVVENKGSEATSMQGDILIPPFKLSGGQSPGFGSAPVGAKDVTPKEQQKNIPSCSFNLKLSGAKDVVGMNYAKCKIGVEFTPSKVGRIYRSLDFAYTVKTNDPNFPTVECLSSTQLMGVGLKSRGQQ